MTTVRNHEYTLTEITDSLREKTDRLKHREQELAEASAKLDKLRTDRERLKENIGDGMCLLLLYHSLAPGANQVTQTPGVGILLALFVQICETESDRPMQGLLDA